MTERATRLARFSITSVEIQKYGGHYGEEQYTVCDCRIDEHPKGNWVEYDDAKAELDATETRLRELEQERDQMVEILKAACDRTWENENAEQVAAIAANGLYWRDRRIAASEATARDLASLRRYTYHLGSCKIWVVPAALVERDVCTCGLDKILSPLPTAETP